MSQAKAGDTVQIHYTGTLDDGTEFDSSRDRDPLEFELGAGSVIPGFDNAVDGMTVGEDKEVHIPADQAYGDRQDDRIQEVPRTALPPEIQPEIGMQLQAQSQSGQVMPLTVTAVTEETITVDGNHPLAGKSLNFAITLVAIS